MIEPPGREAAIYGSDTGKAKRKPPRQRKSRSAPHTMALKIRKESGTAAVEETLHGADCPFHSRQSIPTNNCSQSILICGK